MSFDLAELYRWIDRARVDSGLTWVGVSRQTRVAASTIRRFESAADAEADGVLAQIGWLGVAPEAFVAATTVAGALLPPAGDGLVRVDMGLVAEVIGGRGRVGARTSIQRLVAVAQGAGRTVASFTRWSAV